MEILKMNNSANILNVPAIQKHIQEKHEEFMKDVGNYSQKITADKDLYKTRMAAKIYRILECFVEEKVIDEVIVKEECRCKLFTLIKNDRQKSVNILTDGENIVIEDNSLFILSELSAPFKKVFYNVNVDDYDWVKFSEELLNYIHYVVYNRKAAYEAKIFG